jgi:hypothetical protein
MPARLVWIALLAAAALMAGCGGDGDPGGDRRGSDDGGQEAEAKPGGTLTYL